MRRTSPTQPSSRRKTGRLPGQLVGETGPRRDLEACRRAGPGSWWRRRGGPVSSRRRPSGTGRRDRARRPGVRRCRGRCRVARRARPRARRPTRGCAREGPIGSAGHRHVGGREHDRHAAIGSGQPADERPGPRDRRSVAVRGDRRHPAPGRGIELLDWARAHVSMVALRTSREVPPTVLVRGRTIVPGWPVRPVDPLTVRRRPDYTPAASRPRVATTVRSRIRGQHDPWTTVPVPSTAYQPSSPGTRSVPLPDG